MIKPPDLKALTHEQKDTLIVELVTTVNSLIKRVEDLEGKLAKDSHNSSKPPSSDGLKRKPKSMRESGGQQGGQPGDPGKTLKRVANPDHVVIHPINRQCDACGNLILNEQIVLLPETRQIIDLPPIRFEVTEHRLQSAQCRCGKVHAASFPASLTQAAQYGPHVKAAVVYLTQYQQLPVDRTTQALHDLFDLSISTGTVQAYINEAASTLLPVVDQIGRIIRAAPVAHFDETCMHVGRTQHWLHSASTSSLTWYGSHAKRGKEALDSFGILPTFAGVAVHDGWVPYSHYECEHALCNAHHLRELIFIWESTEQEWAQEMIELLRAAKKEADHSAGQGLIKLAPGRINYFHARYWALVAQGLQLNPQQQRDPSREDLRGRIKQSFAYNLLARMQRYPDRVWRFITDLSVPFDNNQAERDIRMPKLKQKISGCFRTPHGLQSFCIIRSYLASLRKQKRQLFQALALSLSGNPPLFA